MTFVTKLTFESGDRALLDDFVTDLRENIERKGAECKGPHSRPPEELTIPQYSKLGPGDEFPAWHFTVYSRTLEIHGSDETARRVSQMEFPERVHVEIEVDQKKPLGYRRN
jgi:ribosomal protein S10